jgi:hypothetical protein
MLHQTIKDYDDDEKKSYGKDRDESRYDDKYDNDKSYGKDNYKSNDSSVIVKKIKRNNINVNINGLDVNTSIPNGNGPIA